MKPYTLRTTRRPHARYLGDWPTIGPIYRVPVLVRFNNSRGTVDEWCNPPEEWHDVDAPSARAAADYIRDQYARRAETEVIAYGPRGGRVTRYIGWTSAIGARLLALRQEPEPTPLPLRTLHTITR